MIDLRCCDNLKLMKEIDDKTIDLIYSDVLYGTGRDFGDYQDLKYNRVDIERHYMPRIKEMHRILKDTGSIYLQMDYKISHWIRCLMDDVFGYKNIKNVIVWHYHSGGAPKSNFAKKHDDILFYTKTNKNTFNYNDVRIPYPPKSLERLKYSCHGSKWDLDKGKCCDDVWNISILSTASKERNGYATQKPKELIERIIKASSNKGDLVADFYAGSFTTAEVCQDLERDFIGCDINTNAYEIGKKRVEENKKELNAPTLFNARN